MLKRHILVVIGTRPEAIKMAPLVKLLQQDGAFFTQVCVTGQHRQMLDSVLRLFDIVPDFDLDIMKSGQDLTDTTVGILTALKAIFSQVKPDLVLVHGDTTTTFATSLACYYQQIPVGHIEAGLRTKNLFSPYPEEANRALTSVLAQYHFAPTETAKQNLCREGKNVEHIWVTGNTVIDALFLALQKIQRNPPLVQQLAQQYHFLDEHKKLILVTGHRRESFGQGFEQICNALAAIACQHSDVQIVYPVHLNPNVNEPVKQRLADIQNLFLLEPQDYLSFIYLMEKAYLVLTDSGGIQEEAPALNKPVLVMREMTERPEAIEAGTAKLVGTNSAQIIEAVHQLLTNKDDYDAMSQANNPYGDGRACERIVQILKELKE
ncbi:UDP-N-acetylglucosamine 2-epimerase (non-hydrolyzing) [Ursidibacter maritimus]|uniref:UDP-N-acetylglucosamine 2-epimerase n=1 Tax=Ursidibacter maritimus TaxID=1331689 RepID=A0A949T3W4_9PAST|nr:UDP-N-acetylglucosamine 2-epimerase (non-hydrolyzing) [Ursidibacter maritimus]KAE9538765.1 UDP-N-acetyl glucosamine 2-epimerase [Ursidibacter maritimus]MBV6523385.1 UDP-N-acetylglucosamine 2-epimerase (non-hydrolyzing) [Ursidibacter maritimus]MBV6526460.1 UDP-N-acetylglucosamine 2-epimerase (non-hydrolyzing) [Ursidibacter maritimus]MBV6527791.1 UDP-N-acetylglucosamine 2-epimerase (non-hydrolyzing) [Ursidibacter maritimus]MBV6529812.1 UDP-N-acetylglucosamine 2-epimerase (non-hydrolyzing) [Ur